MRRFLLFFNRFTHRSPSQPCLFSIFYAHCVSNRLLTKCLKDKKGKHTDFLYEQNERTLKVFISDNYRKNTSEIGCSYPFFDSMNHQ